MKGNTFTIGHSTKEHQATHVGNIHRSANKYGNNADEICSVEAGNSRFKIMIKDLFESLLKPQFQTIDKSDEINLLSIGCRSFHELDFLEYALKDFSENVTSVSGIDLFNPFNDPRITVDDAEQLSSIKSTGKTFDIIYSDNNLEHLLDPVSHFKNLVDVIKNEAYLFYVLPCWEASGGEDATPTLGHPHLIHCTKTYDAFNIKNINSFLNEMFDLAGISPDFKFDLMHHGTDEVNTVCYFVAKINTIQ